MFVVESVVDTEKKLAAKPETKTGNLLMFMPGTDNSSLKQAVTFSKFIGYAGPDDLILDGFVYCSAEAVIEKKPTLGQKQC